jgi:hypothetical protein
LNHADEPVLSIVFFGGLFRIQKIANFPARVSESYSVK